MAERKTVRELVLIAVMTAITVTVHLFFHVFLPIHIGTALVIISGIGMGPKAGFIIGMLSRFICNFHMGQGPWTPWEMLCWGLLGLLAGYAFNRNSMGKVNSDSFRIVLGPVLVVVFSMVVAYSSFIAFPGKDKSFLGWRIYLFGAIGIVIGFLLQKRRLPVDNVTITVFTFFTTFIIYGGIMNFAAAVMSIGVTGREGISTEVLRALYISGVGYDLVHASTASLCVFLLGNNVIKSLERIKVKYGVFQ